jgi:hypothetical protein
MTVGWLAGSTVPVKPGGGSWPVPWVFLCFEGEGESVLPAGCLRFLRGVALWSSKGGRERWRGADRRAKLTLHVRFPFFFAHTDMSMISPVRCLNESRIPCLCFSIGEGVAKQAVGRLESYI